MAGDLSAIQELLGHRDLGSTHVYTRVAPERLAAIHVATHPDAGLPSGTDGHDGDGHELAAQGSAPPPVRPEGSAPGGTTPQAGNAIGQGTTQANQTAANGTGFSTGSVAGQTASEYIASVNGVPTATGGLDATCSGADRVTSVRCMDGVVPRSNHARRMASILDDHGEDYAVRFLNEMGDVRRDVAVGLRASTVRITTGNLSLWSLDEECEGWMALAIAFMDGYGCDDLFDLWVDALDEFEQYREWPGSALLVFFEAFGEEILGYLAWQVEGSVGSFRTYRNG